MVKKTLFAVCIALTLAWAAPAAADTILFDPDGAGVAFAPISINDFDMSPGNAIGLGANALEMPGDPPFNIYYQANLADAGTFVNGDGGQFFTVAAAFSERNLSNMLIDPGTPLNPADDFRQLAFGFVPGGDNFFQIWVNSAEGNDLNGVCFVCGTLIMQGHIIGFNSPSGSTAFVNQAPENLDQFAGDNYPAIDTIATSGSFDIQIMVDSYNAAYFPNIAPGIVIGFVAADGTTTVPFDAVDPSRCFHATALAGCVGGFDGATLASLGPVNGFGPNLMFETDANLTFQLVSPPGGPLIPEPASLALLGLGLLGTVAVVRRRQRQG